MRRRFWRLTICVLAALLQAGLGAQDTWYGAYQQGVSAFEKKDYARAERKLLEALNHPQAPSARGLSVRWYGQRRDEFQPEYYLTQIYITQGKWADAKEVLGPGGALPEKESRGDACAVRTR